MLDQDIAVLGPAERLETLAKCNDPSQHFGIVRCMDARMRRAACADVAYGVSNVGGRARLNITNNS